MTNKTKDSALIKLITAMFIYGTIGIFRKGIPLPSTLLAFARGIIGSAFVALFVKLKGQKLFHGIGKKKTVLLVISGIIMGFNWILLFEAYNYTSVAAATMCYYMEPTFLILFSAILFHDKLTPRKTIVSLVALIGMILVSGVLEGHTAGSENLKGVLLGVGAAVLYTIVVMFNQRIGSLDPYEKTFIQLLSAAVVLIPYLFLTGGWQLNGAGATAIILLLTVGLVHTGFAYVLYFGSLSSLSAQTVAIFSYIDPITAVLLSALLLREPISIAAIIGSILIIGSAAANELLPEKK